MPPKPKKAPVADSWEDESSESEPEPEPSKPAPKSSSQARSSDDGEEDNTDTFGITSRLHSTTLGDSSGRLSPPPRQPPVARGSSNIDSEQKRPEKTNAVARRLIAGALGVRVKTTAEQREYDKALREKEKKKKDEDRKKAREEEERKEKAKREIWED